MKIKMFILLFFLSVQISTPSWAAEKENHDVGASITGEMQMDDMRGMEAPDGKPHDLSGRQVTDIRLRASVVDAKALRVGKVNALVLKLTDDGGSPISLEQLKEVHTKKIHLLLADETLTDYQHMHPEQGSQPGTYVTTFVPENATSYKVWLDVTPVGGNQQFIPIVLQGKAPCAVPCVKKSLSSEGTSGGLAASISFKNKLKVGVAEMGTLTLKDNEGKPVTNLEPVMGAFAHIVGLYEDFETIAHIHPMGQEPKSDAERGGPELSFHLEPEKAGFLKLYAQVRRGDKDIFIPFGVNIE